MPSKILVNVENDANEVKVTAVNKWTSCFENSFIKSSSSFKMEFEFATKRFTFANANNSISRFMFYHHACDS